MATATDRRIERIRGRDRKQKGQTMKTSKYAIAIALIVMIAFSGCAEKPDEKVVEDFVG
ncbi:MAG: hypothetical protein LBN32_01185 [Helicobacteraceae bacterium]|jgi:hypothetical protein|nr:hypothetical protein [Helicobacteraceae bacterium]